jgi:hypothetical protein
MDLNRIAELEQKIEGAIAGARKVHEWGRNLLEFSYRTQVDVSRELLEEVKMLREIVDGRAEEIRTGNTVEFVKDPEDPEDAKWFREENPWLVPGMRGKVVEPTWEDQYPDHQFVVVFDGYVEDEIPLNFENIRKIKTEG